MLWLIVVLATKGKRILLQETPFTRAYFDECVRLLVDSDEALSYVAELVREVYEFKQYLKRADGDARKWYISPSACVYLMRAAAERRITYEGAEKVSGRIIARTF